MRIGDLIERARAAVSAGGADPAVHGLTRLSGGMSHDVFALVDDPTLVVKAFRTAGREEPEREWDALLALTGSGMAPEPVHFDRGDSAIVVMTRVFGSSLSAGELGAKHARLIGNVHRRVHRTIPGSRRPLSHSAVWGARASLMLDERQATSQLDEASDVVDRAWRAA